jgi:hypothetical protein
MNTGDTVNLRTLNAETSGDLPNTRICKIRMIRGHGTVDYPNRNLRSAAGEFHQCRKPDQIQGTHRAILPHYQVISYLDMKNLIANNRKIVPKTRNSMLYI